MLSSLFHTLNISRRDIVGQLNDLDVTSNNLANVNTPGYKTSRANFQELLDQQIKEGNKVAGTQMLPTQGEVKPSDNPLDWAIQGDGYFSVTLPDGKIGYTRDGQFKMDTDRNLVTAGGYPLVWDGSIPEGTKSVSITVDGLVNAVSEDGTIATVGTVELSRFTNPTALQNHGENLWMETSTSGAAQAGAAASENFGMINGSMVEQSNVDISQEMTHLITLQRKFSMSIKAFQQTDTMISQAINLRKA